MGGKSLSENYWSIASLTPTHSFSENSYLALLVLFGVFGIIIIIPFITTTLKKAKGLAYRGVLMIVLVIFFVHDTVLYVQGFLGLVGALIIVATDDRQNAFMFSCRSHTRTEKYGRNARMPWKIK